MVVGLRRKNQYFLISDAKDLNLIDMYCTKYSLVRR